MFERFTDRARRVLVVAQEEASQFNHSFMGTVHILLSLIREEERSLPLSSLVLNEYQSFDLGSGLR
jgi:ATP-dependent Clp protease ATP-binding subunit ClpA